MLIWHELCRMNTYDLGWYMRKATKEHVFHLVFIRTEHTKIHRFTTLVPSQVGKLESVGGSVANRFSSSRPSQRDNACNTIRNYWRHIISGITERRGLPNNLCAQVLAKQTTKLTNDQYDKLCTELRHHRHQHCRRCRRVFGRKM